jgi:type VI secretion system secreted protein VgrG
MAATQKDRSITIKSPLEDDVLLFESLSGQERLSSLYGYELTVLSESGELSADKLLGQQICVSFQPDKGPRRFIHGIATDFEQTGWTQNYHQYRLTVRPWLWLLTRTADCRIYQEKSIPDIFEAVAKEYGFTDYRLDLKRSYATWEYCVQYRETDFNFISRLLEQEGIYYYFEHHEGRHDLVLADDPACHKKRTGYETVPYYAPGTNESQRERDHLANWTVSASVQPGCYALTDFDFKKPRKTLLGKGSLSAGHARANFEIFDYPAELQEQEGSETERIAKVRIEELHALRSLARGGGDAGGLVTGAKFHLEKYPRKDLNIDYLIVGSSFSLSSNAYDSGGSGADSDLSVSIEAVDATTAFRPSRMTPKPIIQGSQTAIVVGKANEEIWTDEYGQVKVQFHWDRYGKRDENSSCWMRVAQVWAGEQWGAMHTPRIGQEVIVSFLEGDPDQPIITGRVYNGANKPPYGENATRSGIKSRSSKNGTAENANEIRFEDKKDEEQLFFHAEKDLLTEVEHDQKISVGNDETVQVKHDRTATVDNNEKLKVGKNRTEEVGDDDKVKIGKTYVLEAGDQITLKSGSSELVMKKDGTITLKGAKITIDASQTLTEKAGQKVEVKAMQIAVKGTKVEVEGTMLDLKASAIATLKGSLTKIG